MRDIKFRAWDGEEMYHQENVGDDFDFVIGSETSLALTVNEQFHECGSGVAEEYWQYVIKEAEFMQFTGLQDKNGVDIYELMEIDGTYNVEFKNGSYVLVDISNGDIILLYNYIESRVGNVKITRDYAKI